MIRVATYGNYQTALLNLMSAQQRGHAAELQLSSGKVGHNHSDFGRTSETITALKSTRSRIEGFKQTSQATVDRLTTQDLALERIASSATETRNAITNALANGRAEGLMTEISALFQAVQDGLNTKHQGKYVFAGGAVETVPSSVQGLEGLAAVADIADIFRNDRLKQAAWVDENINVDVGYLADDLGTELYEIFQDIAQFNQGEELTGILTDTQKTFLTAQISRLDQAARSLVTVQAANGAVLSRTENILETHVVRADSLEIMLSGKTDADMAKVVTEIELSQIAIQASAQVISQLRQVSLLDYLR